MRVLLWTLLGGCAPTVVDETGGTNLGGQAGEDTGLDCGTPIHTTYEAEAVTPLGETVRAHGTAAEAAREVELAWTGGGAAVLGLTIVYEGAGGAWTNATTCEERLEIAVAVTATDALAFDAPGLLRLTGTERALYVGLAPGDVGGWQVPDSAARVEIHLDRDGWTGVVRVVHADGTLDDVASLGGRGRSARPNDGVPIVPSNRRPRASSERAHPEDTPCPRNRLAVTCSPPS